MKYYKSYEDFNKIEDGDEINENILSSIFSDIKDFFSSIFKNIKVNWDKIKTSIKNKIYSQDDVSSFEKDLDTYKNKNNISSVKIKDMEHFIKDIEKNDPEKVNTYKSIANDIGSQYKEKFIDNSDLIDFKEDFAKFYKEKHYKKVDTQSIKDFVEFVGKYKKEKYSIYSSIFTAIKTGEIKVV